MRRKTGEKMCGCVPPGAANEANKKGARERGEKRGAKTEHGKTERKKPEAAETGKSGRWQGTKNTRKERMKREVKRKRGREEAKKRAARRQEGSGGQVTSRGKWRTLVGRGEEWRLRRKRVGEEGGGEKKG